MNVLFATGHPYLPEMRGGMQYSSHSLANGLKSRGTSVAVLSGLTGNGSFGMRARLKLKLFRGKATRDRSLGYPVWRAWFPWEAAAELVRRENFDLAVIMARKPVRLASAFQAAGLPVLMWLLDVEFNDHGGEFESLGNVPSVANSQFTAACYRERYGLSPSVIHPLVYQENYATESSRETVTFINPVANKGLHLALAVARSCPDIPFLFVESWPLSAEERRSLMAALADLPNVTLHPPVSDMRLIYGRTRILLAPSQWREAYGRVATEAQFSGIPVIASSIGGLPEAVGDGGILIDGDAGPDAWTAALRRLWSDRAWYSAMSAAALAYSQREAVNPRLQIDRWIAKLHEAANAS